MPEIFIGRALGETTKIRLGPAPVCLNMHHPFHVASRLAFLDHLSKGRLNLCFGPGSVAGDMEPMAWIPRMLRGWSSRPSTLSWASGRLVLPMSTPASSGRFRSRRSSTRLPRSAISRSRTRNLIPDCHAGHEPKLENHAGLRTAGLRALRFRPGHIERGRRIYGRTTSWGASRRAGRLNARTSAWRDRSSSPIPPRKRKGEPLELDGSGPRNTSDSSLGPRSGAPHLQT